MARVRRPWPWYVVPLLILLLPNLLMISCVLILNHYNR